MPVLGMQTPSLPMFSPIAPTIGMPESAVDRTALYAGETVLRLTSVISARRAVDRADAEVNNEGMSGVLFFDGACGMCTRARDFLVSHDRTGNVETEPLQGAGVAERLDIPR